MEKPTQLLRREAVLPQEHPQASMVAAVLLSALLFSMLSSWMMFAAAAAHATPRTAQPAAVTYAVCR